MKFTEKTQTAKLKLLEAMFEQTNTPMLITTAELDLPGPQIVFVNSALSRMTGYAPVELIGQTPRILQGVKTDREALKRLRENLSRGEVFHGETYNYRKDGSSYYLEWHISPIRDEHGRVTHFASVQKDVTVRKQFDEITREVQEYRNLFNLVNDSIIVFDATARLVLNVNERACDSYQIPRRRFVGLHLDEILNESSADSEMLAQLLTRGKVGEFETVHRRGDGANLYVVINSSLVNYQGKPAVLSINRDVTERHNAALAVKKAKEEWTNTVDAISDLIVLADSDGKIRRCNRAAAVFFALPYENLIGQSLDDLLQSENSGNFNNKFGDSDKSANWEERVTGRDELFEFSSHPVEFGDETQRGYVLICRDTTEKQRLESIAEAVNMMENVGYVFSGIRHELGNPINSVKTALSVLRKNIDVWEKEQTITYIERSLQEIGRVEYLLRALKTFSFHENPKMQKLSLHEFMSSFVTLIEGDFAQRGIEIKLSEKDVGAAWFDPRALHQVMLNLAANADDALAETENAEIFITLNRDERFVRVSVRDNGAGMTELQKENLFKPFYTSKPDGTGLGLVIVKKMIAKMNGTIKIQSTHGIGTEVKFALEAAK